MKYFVIWNYADPCGEGERTIVHQFQERELAYDYYEACRNASDTNSCAMIHGTIVEESIPGILL
jgi:hypothetical protein